MYDNLKIPYLKYLPCYQELIEYIEENYSIETAYRTIKALIRYGLYGEDIEDDLKLYVNPIITSTIDDKRQQDIYINYFNVLINGIPNNDESGYVYIIKVDSYYKIGRTSNPNNRFGEYTKLMKEPEVISLTFCNNYKQVEKELHKMFSDRNTNGEWFTLTDEELDKAIQYLKENEINN